MRAGNEQGRGGGVGTTHPMRCRDRSLRGGERIYEDFSFLALGESAAWEFTPLTPLAKSQNKNRIIYHITITSEGNLKCLFREDIGALAKHSVLISHLCLSLICSWRELASFSRSESGRVLSTDEAGS